MIDVKKNKQTKSKAKQIKHSKAEDWKEVEGTEDGEGTGEEEDDITYFSFVDCRLLDGLQSHDGYQMKDSLIYHVSIYILFGVCPLFVFHLLYFISS